MDTNKLNQSKLSTYTEKLILKLLFEHKLIKKFVTHHNEYNDDKLAESLGLPDPDDNTRGLVDLPFGKEDENNLRNTTRKLLKQRYKQIKHIEDKIPDGLTVAYENLSRIKQYLELDDEEYKVLQFSLHIDSETELETVLDWLGSQNFNTACEFIGELLELPKSKVISILKKSNKLVSYGLIKTGDRYGNDVDDYVNWGSVLNLDHFLTFPIDEQSLLRACLKPAHKPTITLEQFDHIVDMRKSLLDYLKSSIDTEKKGSNILLYGAPGTGKTELAILLAQELNLPCYCLHYQDEDGEVIDGEQRLNNCHLAQKLLSQKSAMIIFDEVEDIFASSLFERSVAQKHKAWMNDFLENNTTPMIWISNSVQGVDLAYLRRFDLIFEMPNLPMKHREKLIREQAGNYLSEEEICYFSQMEELSPAILTRGISVAKQLKSADQNLDFSQRLVGLLNQTLLAQGRKKLPPLMTQKMPYSLDYVACDADIYKVTQGLQRNKQGRICCYGPPGTGKTAWAEWLAQQLDMPLLLRKGSDLLGKYVGETEKNIANAFEQAQTENMLLVFDEVDSFLFAREGAQRSWERNLVNEMLTQIERFEGLMIVSTNLMNELDPAALRRFDLKLKFDYLKPDQVLNFAELQAKKLGLALDEKTSQKLTALSMLTLGDFAAVARRHRFAPFDCV